MCDFPQKAWYKEVTGEKIYPPGLPLKLNCPVPKAMGERAVGQLRPLHECSCGHGEQLALSFLFASPWIYFWLCTRLKTGLEATSVLNGKLGQDTESLPNLCLMRKSAFIAK